MTLLPRCVFQAGNNILNFETKTDMRREIEEIPFAIERLLSDPDNKIAQAAKALRDLDPQFITTVARGSSDHAATYLKYAIEICAQIPVASLGPSTASIYQQTLKLQNSASLIISQSGASPDIVQMAQSAKAGGAMSLSITNNVHSPLSESCEYVLDMHAGVEKSVAATKTFVTSIVAGLLLLAHWTNDQELLRALKMLPEHSAKAINCSWQILNENLRDQDSLLVLGRGPSMAIANEVALKFKETCQIHAEAYSSAEVLHGPVSIVEDNYPILMLDGHDASHQSIMSVGRDLANQGADVFITSEGVEGAVELPIHSTGHPMTNPLLLIVSFYAFIEQLSRDRGLNPDVPPKLRKVTKTI